MSLKQSDWHQGAVTNYRSNASVSISAALASCVRLEMIFARSGSLITAQGNRVNGAARGNPPRNGEVAAKPTEGSQGFCRIQCLVLSWGPLRLRHLPVPGRIFAFTRLPWITAHGNRFRLTHHFV